MHRIIYNPRAVKVAIAKDGECNLYQLHDEGRFGRAHEDYADGAGKLSSACTQQRQRGGGGAIRI